MKLYPSLRYRDAKAAHQWLQDAFGLEPHALYEDDDGNVVHAEMRWGTDMIMFGTARDDAYGHRVGQGWLYASCDDPDALCERARKAGAEITMEPTDQDYGSRDFAARDLEGNQWNFGTYEPT
jgi:uncharacterized glyoxalase superfamily protein PhnB